VVAALKFLMSSEKSSLMGQVKPKGREGKEMEN
jgi:hypothetical protein